MKNRNADNTNATNNGGEPA